MTDKPKATIANDANAAMKRLRDATATLKLAGHRPSITTLNEVVAELEGAADDFTAAIDRAFADATKPKPAPVSKGILR